MSDLLRICTSGSVDDGKSTLIGRLLYDSRAVYEDQVHAVRRASERRQVGPIDFSLFTDGLRAEREQGITIDVAYRYFATSRRKFILADTPGHEQYTRNMVTGASTADVAILLVDARHGMRDQTRRHAAIARMLGISTFVLAVNKMDLVGFDRTIYDEIRTALEAQLGGAALHAIPISALHGDNVTTSSERTPWYGGPTLLEYLETVEIARTAATQPFRFPVQLVLRPTAEFRGYAGQIAAGQVRVGDRVTVWPSGRETTIARLVTRDGDLDLAFAPMSIVIVLADEVDVSRGDVLAVGPVHVETTFEAHVVWMDERPSEPGRVYLLKAGTDTVVAQLDRSLALNAVETITVTAARPIVFDTYRTNRTTGSFIVIDPASNFTAGAGIVLAPVRAHDGTGPPTSQTAAERLVEAARGASTHTAAIEAVQRMLQEILT
jgi:sulfate adenylyltransferase large subunit